MSGSGAFRPTGLVVVVSRGGAIYKHLGSHTRPWQPNLSDVVATDWSWGLLDNIARQFAAQAAEGGEPEE